MADTRVLVVGTTPDYIAYINERYPGRALFLTDVMHRPSADYPAPDEADELVCPLVDTDGAMQQLHDHLLLHRQSLSGVAGYDCEWLALAAHIAAEYGLPFPSVDSVLLSRNKHLTKVRWTEQGVRCPITELIYTGAQAVRFATELGRAIVLKPLTGSGSELTFRCQDRFEAIQAFSLIKAGLARRAESPLYSSTDDRHDEPAPTDAMLAEEYVEGREYSADFEIDGDQIVLIRVAKKMRSRDLPFGTTLAYVVPARMPGWLDYEALEGRLREAAQALGLTRAICMVDFIVSHDEIVFLELTPRIGGDCLPPLVRHCSGLDTIGLALDFAEKRRLSIPPHRDWELLVGLRLFAARGGVVTSMNTEALRSDPLVREIYLKRKPGHLVSLPPEDYDSWLLGHVIFAPGKDIDLSRQCDRMNAKFTIEMEPFHGQRQAGFHATIQPPAQSADTTA